MTTCAYCRVALSLEKQNLLALEWDEAKLRCLSQNHKNIAKELEVELKRYRACTCKVLSTE